MPVGEIAQAAAIVVGALLVVAAFIDVVWTTIASGSGAGPITGVLAPLMWRMAIAINRRRRSHRFLSAAAVLLVLLVMATWIAMTVAGWWLITLGGDAPIVTTDSGVVAGAIDRLYFVGYSVFTLGNGDFRPDGAVWQMLTVAMTASGLVLVSLSITYLVPLAGTGATQRQVATLIFSLGETPEETVLRGWNGRDFGYLERHLIGLTPQLHSLAQSHLTYPILHYLHPVDRRFAVATSLTNLALALDLLESAIQPEARPPVLVTEPCRQAIDSFLVTLEGAHVHPADQPLALPSLAGLEEAGLPLVPLEEYRDDGASSQGTRRLLAGLLRHTGWD